MKRPSACRRRLLYPLLAASVAFTLRATMKLWQSMDAYAMIAAAGWSAVNNQTAAHLREMELGFVRGAGLKGDSSENATNMGDGAEGSGGQPEALESSKGTADADDRKSQTTQGQRMVKGHIDGWRPPPEPKNDAQALDSPIVRDDKTSWEVCLDCDLANQASAYDRLWCRWMRRQESIAAGVWQGLANATVSRDYDKHLTIGSPSISGLCDPLRKRLRWDGACASVGHRQKPAVKVTVSTESWLSGEMDLGLHDCPATRCTLEKGAGYENGTNVFLSQAGFGGLQVGQPQKDRQDQVNVLMSIESTLKPHGGASHVGVDWLASYRRKGNFSVDDWVPVSYINSDLQTFRIQGKEFAQRRNEIPVFIGNCGSLTCRNRVVSSLAALLPIESFGKCAFPGARQANFEELYPACRGQPRKSAMWDAQKECVFFHSKFSLVLENTFEQEYVTEKLWQPLKMGALPIIWGDPSLYRQLLPAPNSAIFLDDFIDFADAAKYIEKVSQSESLWAKHVSWKNEVFSSEFTCRARRSFATVACSLCDKYWQEENPNQHSQHHLPSIDIVNPCVTKVLARSKTPKMLQAIDPAYGIDAVFVVHYTPLKERKALMRQRVRDQFNIDPIFITDFDREALSDDDINCFSSNRAEQKAFFRATTKGEDSLSIKHHAAYYHMVRLSLQNVLVLEDDTSFIEGDFKEPHVATLSKSKATASGNPWKERKARREAIAKNKTNLPSRVDWRRSGSIWQSILRDLPVDYDVLFLSGIADIHEAGEKISPNLYLAQRSRVTDMYLISQKGARNMLRSLPLMAPIDWHFDYVGGHRIPSGERNFTRPRVENIKLLHSEPWLSKQFDPSGYYGTAQK